MSAVALVARAEVRRRRVALTGLALLIGISGAVVIASAAGARRTSDAVDRFLEASNMRDLQVQIDSVDVEAEPVWEELRQVPGVRSVAPLKFMFVDVGSEFDFGVIASNEPRLLTEFDVPRVLAGRMPDSIDEIAINEEARDELDVGVGDTISGGTFSPDGFACLMAGGGCEVGAGPELALKVVGVLRLPEDLNSDPSRNQPAAVTTAAFYERYADEVGGFDRYAAVELAPGADADGVASAIEQLVPAGTTLFIESGPQSVLDVTGDGIDALVVAIIVFAVVAGLAGAFVCGQAMARQVAATAADLRALGPLGATRRERAFAVAATLAPAIVVGCLLAVTGAVVGSFLFPFGLAGKAEPDPGVSIDTTVLVVGVLAGALLAVLWCIATSWRATGRTRAVSVRASRSSAALARIAIPVIPATGARFAFEHDRGRGTASRTAVAVATVAFTGVVGAAAFAATADRLYDTPARWGHSWDLGPLDFGDDDSAYAGTLEEGLAALDEIAGDERISATGVLASGYVELDGEQVQGASIDARSGSLLLPVIAGRQPASPDEVALGAQTMDRLGVRIGDRVEAAASDEAAEDARSSSVLVVGRAVLPDVDANEPGEGAVFTRAGFEAHQRSDGEEGLVVDLAADAELDDVVALLDDHGFIVSAYAYATPPAPVFDLRAIRSLPIALGAFFGLLGSLALAHAVLVTAQRRRRELGVLQALGLRRRQVRAVPPWQAVAIVAVGAIVGIPLGVAAGRFAWRRVADGIGVAPDLAVPVGAVLGVVAAALVAAVAVGTLSARLAVRRTPAFVLRAE